MEVVGDAAIITWLLVSVLLGVFSIRGRRIVRGLPLLGFPLVWVVVASASLAIVGLATEGPECDPDHWPLFGDVEAQGLWA